MKCKVTVKLNPDLPELLDKARKRALDKTAEALRSDIESRGVVPKDVGELERSGFVDLSHIDYELVASIVYDTPYARRWYFNREGVNFSKIGNPNAQDHWMDYYFGGEGLQWLLDKYAEFLKEESGGLIT